MYHLLPNFRPIIGIELGVAEAKLSVQMLNRIPNLQTLYLVDPWIAYQDWWGPIPQASQNVNERTAMESLAPYMDRVEIVKKYTNDALDDLEGREYDFVYVDADHSYAWVLHDLHAYWPLIAEGGILAGHDRSLPEVHRALTDFCRDIRVQYTASEDPQQDSWYIVKGAKS